MPINADRLLDRRKRGEMKLHKTLATAVLLALLISVQGRAQTGNGSFWGGDGGRLGILPVRITRGVM